MSAIKRLKEAIDEGLIVNGNSEGESGEIVPASQPEPNLATLVAKQRQSVLDVKTPPAYISLKDGMPYLPNRYVDDVFNKFYPIHTIEIMNEGVFKDYYVWFDVKITVPLPNGQSINKIGSGAARIQVSKSAREDFVENGKFISPFDYVDYGNARKSALTNAIKNAQERFGVGADVNDRIILSDEEIKLINDKYDELFESIIDPRTKNKVRERWLNAKKPSEKLKVIEQLKEILQ